MILYSEGATKFQEGQAKDILEVLTFAYPNHPWGVRVYDGGFFIRHLDFPYNYGMNCKFKSTNHDWAVLKRQIIMLAGEWLERANLKRGRGEDAPIERVEGVPEQYQPNRPIEIPVVIGGRRDTTRPEVEQMVNNLG